MRTTRRKLEWAAICMVVFLSFGAYLATASYWTGNNFTYPWVKSSLADEGEDDGDDGDEDKDEDEDEDRDEDESKDDDNDDDANELEKKRLETARETAKKQAEALKEDSESEMNDDGKEDEEDDLNDDRDDDSEAMYKDKNKTLEKLQEEIAKAKEKIIEQAMKKGFSAQAALDQVNALNFTALEAAYAAGNLELAKELAKDIKKEAHLSSGKLLEDIEDVAKDIAKVQKRITQTERMIAALAVAGGDTESFTTLLDNYKTEFAAIQTEINNPATQLSGLAKLDVLERQVKRLKSSVENALLALTGYEDDDFEDEHEDDIDEISDDIEELTEVEDDSLGRSIAAIVRTHRDEAKKVKEELKDTTDRNVLAKVLFGFSDAQVADLESAITANEARIATLETLAAKIDDAEIKEMIQEQIDLLTSENLNLKSYVTALEQEPSLLGWFFHLF